MLHNNDTALKVIAINNITNYKTRSIIILLDNKILTLSFFLQREIFADANVCVCTREFADPNRNK